MSGYRISITMRWDFKQIKDIESKLDTSARLKILRRVHEASHGIKEKYRNLFLNGTISEARLNQLGNPFAKSNQENAIKLSKANAGPAMKWSNRRMLMMPRGAATGTRKVKVRKPEEHDYEDLGSLGYLKSKRMNRKRVSGTPVPLLPINRQSGNLFNSLYVRKIASNWSVLLLYNNRPTGQNGFKYTYLQVKSPDGSRLQVPRGLDTAHDNFLNNEYEKLNRSIYRSFG